jgi:hypothetical protein
LRKSENIGASTLLKRPCARAPPLLHTVLPVPTDAHCREHIGISLKTEVEDGNLLHVLWKVAKTRVSHDFPDFPLMRSLSDPSRAGLMLVTSDR